jgi:predicted ATP-grasp superfamily ATP-dependent carboligase
VPASVAFLAGQGTRIALQPCYQELSDDGRFHYLGGRAPLPADLAGRAISLATAAMAAVEGMLGYGGVDLVLGSDPSADRIIEINPRLTTSYVGLRLLADFNIAEMLLRVVRGEMPRLTWRTGRVEFTPENAGYSRRL